jgi:pantetheine-phosphate adenylyltransferase
MGGAVAPPPPSPPPHLGPRTGVYPGVFDPPTVAHLALIEAALRIFDRLVVVVAVNPSKPAPLFAPEERVALLRESLAAWPPELAGRVEVRAHAGVIAPYAERLGASALVRGMRPVTDPEVEIAQALMNAKLAPRLPTVLLVAPAEYVYLSSTFVRDLARLEGLIAPGTVPPPVERALRERFGAPGAPGASGALPRAVPGP